MGRSENSSFSDLLNLCTICNQSFDQGQLIVHQNEAHHVTLDRTKGTISTETAGPEQNDDDNGQLTDDDEDDLGDDDHNYDNEEEEDSDDDGSSISSWGSATTVDDDDDSMDLEDFPLVTKDADFVSNADEEKLLSEEGEEDSIGKIMQVCTIKNLTVMNQQNDTTTTTTTMQPDKNYMDDDDNMDIVEVVGSSTNKPLPSLNVTQQQQNLKSSSASDNDAKENLTEIESPPPSLSSSSSSTFSQPVGLEPQTGLNKPQLNGAQGQVNSASDVHDDDDEVQCIEPNASNTTATPLTSSQRINKHNYHRFQARDVNFDVVNSSPIDSPTDKSPVFKNPGVHQSQLKPDDDSLSEKSSTTGVTIRKIGMIKEQKNMDNIVAPTTATTSKSTVKTGKNWEPGFIYVEVNDGTVTKHPMKPLLKNEYFIAESDPLEIPDGGLDPDDDRSQSPPLLFPNILPQENSLEKSPQDNYYSPLKLRQADSRRNSDNNNNDSMSPLKIISPTIQTPQKTYESCDEVPEKIQKIARSKFNQKLIEDLVRTLGRKSSMSKKKSLKKRNEMKVAQGNKPGRHKKKFNVPILAAPNVIPLDEMLVSKIHNNHNDSGSSSSSSHFNDWSKTGGQVKRKAGRPKKKSKGTEMFSDDEEKNESLAYGEQQHNYHQQDFSRSGRRIKKSTKFMDYDLDG